MVLNANHPLTARDLDDAERFRAGFIEEARQDGYEGRPLDLPAACARWGDGMSWQPVGPDLDAAERAWQEGAAQALADRPTTPGCCGICERHVGLVETGIGGDPPFFPSEPFGICRPCDHWLRTGEFLPGHEPEASQ